MSPVCLKMTILPYFTHISWPRFCCKKNEVLNHFFGGKLISRQLTALWDLTYSYSKSRFLRTVAIIMFVPVQMGADGQESLGSHYVMEKSGPGMK